MLAKFAELLRISEKIVFFGGAGVSTESGIPDFRSADGLYSQKLNKKFSPEQMVSHSFFTNYPDEFWEFYRKRLVFPKVEPNECHKSLVKLEQMGKLSAVITQNIDGLHQKAGSKRVLELHGSVLRNYCTKCNKLYDVDTVLALRGTPHCDCGHILKPDVVLYEEPLNQGTIIEAVEEIRQADMLIVGGTSLVVYPAAGFVREYQGDRLVVLNQTATWADKDAAIVIREPIGRVMSEALRLMEAG